MKTQILTSAIFMHLVSCGTQQGLKLEDDRIIQDTTNQIPQKPPSDTKAPSVVKKDSPQPDGLEREKNGDSKNDKVMVPTTGKIRVHLTGPSLSPEDSKNIFVVVFEEENANEFTDEDPKHPFYASQVEATNNSFELVDIPPGVYGLTLYVDKTRNKILDSMMNAIPKEPFGFSQNIFSIEGLASFLTSDNSQRFKKAQFPVDAGKTIKLDIKLIDING